MELNLQFIKTNLAALKRQKQKQNNSYFSLAVYVFNIAKIVFFTKPFYIFYPKKMMGNPIKKIFIDINNNPFSRYLYTLIKFFTICKIQVYLPKNRMLFYQLKADKFASLILKEKLVKLTNNKKQHFDLVLNNKNLSANYFQFLIKNKLNNSEYFIPITQHPEMYSQNYWNQQIESESRKNSVFMIGAFNKSYLQIANQNYFDVINRLDLKSTLTEQKNYLQPKSEKELNDFIISAEDQKLIIADTKTFKIPLIDLRKILAKFNFYFAMPGQVMPLCHNIIEAMSVGCIPILEDKYASLFFPNLGESNSIIFNTENLGAKIESLFSLRTEEIERLRKNVLDYSDKNLSPKSVIKNMMDNKFSKFYLLAEHNSLEKLNSDK